MPSDARGGPGGLEEEYGYTRVSPSFSAGIVLRSWRCARALLHRGAAEGSSFHHSYGPQPRCAFRRSPPPHHRQ
jgi:hypothetical protein